MRKTKITRKRWKPWETATIKKMIKQGKTNIEIAQALDRTPVAIYERRRHLKLSLGDFPGSKATQKITSKKVKRLFWGPLPS